MENNLQNEILERLVRLETKLDNYNGLREKLDNAVKKNEVQDNEMKALNERLNKIEDSTKWLLRLVGGAIILAAISANIYFK
jgi:tetrahydromethanopterin S-methyltransferase subunit G